jgi:hypothetical protein
VANQTVDRSRRYTDEEIETGLQAVAIYAGNAVRAAQALEDQGITIPESTLNYWKRTHTQRYHDIRTARVPQLRERLAVQFEDAAAYTMEVAHLASQKAQEQLQAGQNKNPADAAAKLSTAANLMNANASLLRGHTTTRLEITDATQLLAELATKLPNAGIIDTTAEEITA